MAFNFGFRVSNSAVSGISVSRGRRPINKVIFPSGTTYFETATHRVFVLTTTTTMTVQGNPKFSYWSSGAGGYSYGGCFGHAGVGGGGAGGVSQITDDTMTVPAGEYNVIVPGKGGGDTYIENAATSSTYCRGYVGGGGNQGNGVPGGCGGGGGNQ